MRIAKIPVRPKRRKEKQKEKLAKTPMNPKGRKRGNSKKEKDLKAAATIMKKLQRKKKFSGK